MEEAAAQRRSSPQPVEQVRPGRPKRRLEWVPMPNDRTERKSEVFKSSAIVWACGAVALVLVAAFALVGLWPLTRGRDGVERVRTGRPGARWR